MSTIRPGRVRSIMFGILVLGTGTTLGWSQGTIVYHNPFDHLMLSRGFTEEFYNVDIDSNGTVDFVFRADTAFHIYSTTGNRTIAVDKPPPDLGSFSIPLDQGFLIEPVLTDPLSWQDSFLPGFPPDYWIGQTLHRSDSLGTLGFWQPQMTAYIGVEFQIESGVHYGWIRLTTPFSGGINGGTIHDWAYNAIPGQPILAGQVPEPSTWALLMGGGAILLVLFRMRSY